MRNKKETEKKKDFREMFLERLETPNEEVHRIERLDRNSLATYEAIGLKLNEIIDVINAMNKYEDFVAEFDINKEKEFLNKIETCI